MPSVAAQRKPSVPRVSDIAAMPRFAARAATVEMMSASILLDFLSFAEVDSAGKIEGLRFPFCEKEAFAEKPPRGLTVARVNLLDARIPNLKGHGFDRNFNVHGEVHAADRFLVYPNFNVGFVGRCDFVFH